MFSIDSVETISKCFNIAWISQGFEMANCPGRIDMSSLPLQKKYRSHFEILALMLETVKSNDGNGAAPFSIMRNTSLNSAQMKKYIRSLSEMGFIEVDNGRHRIIYKATDRGLDFLKQYNILQRMMQHM